MFRIEFTNVGRSRACWVDDIDVLELSNRHVIELVHKRGVLMSEDTDE